MKRISILVALSVLAPSLCHAYSYSPLSYQIHFSPYTFSYHNSGLVPGGIRFSSYAYSLRSSGLVYAGTRYTPYAFNYRHSGLIADYHRWPVSTCVPSCACGDCCSRRNDGDADSAGGARPVQVVARRHSVSTEELRQIREADGMPVVREYLKSRGFRQVEVNHRLSVENRTAGVAFILWDKNLVIKYRNPDVIQAAEADHKTKAIERYDERWETFAREFEARGGTVYDVTASDKDKIVAALDSCDRLNSVREALRAPALYARE